MRPSSTSRRGKISNIREKSAGPGYLREEAEGSPKTNRRRYLRAEASPGVGLKHENALRSPSSGGGASGILSTASAPRSLDRGTMADAKLSPRSPAQPFGVRCAPHERSPAEFGNLHLVGLEQPARGVIDRGQSRLILDFGLQ